MMAADVVELSSVKTVEGSDVKTTVKSGKVKVDDANVFARRIGGDAVFVMPAKAAVGERVEKQSDAKQLPALTRPGGWHPAYLLCPLPCSTSTSAYTARRARLPLPVIFTLAREAEGVVAEGAAGWWHWRGRRVRLVDGATMTLADTEENQAAYPQPKSQKTGLGFPICRIVVLLCLATGALLNAATGPGEGKGSDDKTLLRALLDTLQRG